MKYIVVFFILFTNFLYSIENSKKNTKTKENLSKNYSVFFYGGQFINSDLLPIMIQGDIKYLPSYIGVTGITFPLKSNFKKFSFESEGQLVKHFGLMNHLEINTAVLARTNILKSAFSFAFGEGLSYATENPGLENRKKYTWNNGSFNANDSVNSRNLLNFLVFELDYSLGDYDMQPKLFARIHHRSGVFGLFCGPAPCGSNFLAYGLKLTL